jgi:hypothetical protein
MRQVEGSDDEPRFGMLETIREFGQEQLEAAATSTCSSGATASTSSVWPWRRSPT